MKKVFMIFAIQESTDNAPWNRSPKVCFKNKETAIADMKLMIDQETEIYMKDGYTPSVTADSDTKALLEVVEAGITISYEICELSIV